MPRDLERDACTVTFGWFKRRALLEQPSEDLVVRHARAYIMLLLSTALFGDKTAARVHLRWLPFVDHIDDLGIQMGICSSSLTVQESMPSSYQERRLVGRWRRYLPTSDEKDPRVIQHRRQLDRMTFHEFICVLYRVDAVEAVVHPSILHPDHKALWTSIIPLIYFGSIEWHQVDRVIP
ncbi:hypothetical protein PIB30_051811 [Stylosanthes scabra]|uniref:Aminotransferase-like plant mobile domain-containing protein n=1 Tax=Stylosanthes scabra TaxID=79078 RepID=A0ABU6VHQ1_9FABA|nr:hypothetical protein [Stylosanthes scabra]